MHAAVRHDPHGSRGLMDRAEFGPSGSQRAGTHSTFSAKTEESRVAFATLDSSVFLHQKKTRHRFSVREQRRGKERENPTVAIWVNSRSISIGRTDFYSVWVFFCTEAKRSRAVMDFSHFWQNLKESKVFTKTHLKNIYSFAKTFWLLQPSFGTFYACHLFLTACEILTRCCCARRRQSREDLWWMLPVVI